MSFCPRDLMNELKQVWIVIRVCVRGVIFYPKTTPMKTTALRGGGATCSLNMSHKRPINKGRREERDQFQKPGDQRQAGLP